MKKSLKLAGIFLAVAVLGVVVILALMPWMDRWGATKDEIAASFPGDELVPSPRIIYTRAISINASPEEIYPWIVQLGAERGGMYSYEWFETNILRCELINADRIHEEWQNLKVGDQVKMCPGSSGPPPYEVAIIEPGRAMILGHQEKDTWIEVWQFILVPQADGSTRLILRSRNSAQGWFWDVIRPGEFIMARGMLLGIKERAEHLAGTGSVPPVQDFTPTPEVFIPLDKAIPDYGITLGEVHLDIVNATLNKSFPAGCTVEISSCTPAQDGQNILLVTFKPRDLPDGQMLAYKNLPAVSVTLEGGKSAPYSLYKYDNVIHTLTLGFEVPESNTVFGLKWADLMEIPLEIVP